MIAARFILGAAWAVGLAWAARADTIALRATARIPPGADARLADIAELAGPAATALAGVTIVPASELGPDWARVDVQRVQAALGATGNVPWGLLELRGSACAVSAGARPGAGAGPPGVESLETVTAASIPAGTVEGHIAARIAAELSVPLLRLRLVFDEGDRDFLAMPTAGRAVEARVTARSDRMPVRVTVFEGERILAGRSVAVDVLVQRSIAILKRGVRRGEVMGAEDVQGELRWLGPATGAVPPDRLPGTAVKTAIAAGQIVTANDIQPAVAIRRGDLVTVTSISGGVAVRTTARAKAAAGPGELFDLESLEPDRRERRTFKARASGPGAAVVARGSRNEGPETVEEQP